jgi:hypothetical protein
MHDMGYLSQVAITANLTFRDMYGMVIVNTTGNGPDYSQYVQKIRTPPLKGLRFNRLVTDSRRNTIPTTTPILPNPACDFLLHDGRACDALEAAFLHDGPEIKWLGVIDGPNGLNKLTVPDLQNLRAFLYSL